MENMFFSKILDESTYKGELYHRETFSILLNNVNHIIAEYYDEPEKALYLIELFYTIIEYGNIIVIDSIIAKHISIISESVQNYEEYNVEELTLIILFNSFVYWIFLFLDIIAFSIAFINYYIYIFFV
jgi:hypothetical protein